MGKEGRIAGWGGTEKADLSTSNPTMTKMTITGNAECIKSDPAFSFILAHGAFCSKVFIFFEITLNFRFIIFFKLKGKCNWSL